MTAFYENKANFIQKMFLPYVFLIFITGTKSLIDLNGHSKTALEECKRCKVLVDSYGYWLDQTSRGKFEGGDAAWEETKLKSYSHSEIRLVEIQEGLCSELKKHQDVCYTLAEETESILEKWWFLNDPHSSDLYTWLCIDTLEYCCPANHFGALCTPCTLDENKVICGGHGKCEGEGTRQGNGTCVCERGYAGIHCQECAENFFIENLVCEPCHKACIECTASGRNACKECKVGWQMEQGTCVDVNECLDSSTCKYNEYCTNKQGSYACKLCDNSCKTCEGGGKTNCTACDLNAVLWSGRCVNDALKSKILRNTLKRAALYLGLLVIAFFVFRQSQTLAAIIMVIIAIYMYISEKSMDMNIVDVLLNLLHS